MKNNIWSMIHSSNWRCLQMSLKGGLVWFSSHWPVLAVDGVSVSRRVHHSEAELHSPLLDFHRGRFNLDRALNLLCKYNNIPSEQKHASLQRKRETLEVEHKD